MSLRAKILGAPTHPDPAEVSVDVPIGDLYEMLSNSRRRWALRAVARAREGALDLRTLSRRLTAHELGIQEVRVSSEQRKARYVALYQVHLPKLDELGLVEYKDDRGTIHATRETDQAVAFMEVGAAMVEESANV